MQLFHTRRARISALVCLGIGVSGFTPIPLPAEWLVGRLGRLEAGGKPLDLEIQHARVRWARGEIQATGLVIHLDGTERFRADSAALRMELVPWHAGFLELAGMHLDTASVEADASLQELLEGGGGTSLPADLPFDISTAQVFWNDPGRQIRHVYQLPELRGLLSRDGSELYGTLIDPFGNRAETWVEAAPQFSNWTVDAVCEASPLLLEEIYPVSDVELSADSCALRVHATGVRRRLEGLAVDAHFGNARVALADPELTVAGLSFTARGRLADGIRIDLSGEVRGSVPEGSSFTPTDIAFSLAGQLRRDGQGPLSLHLRGRTEPVVFDQNIVETIRHLDPGTGTPLDAIEPRGTTRVHFAADWREGDPLAWSAHAPLRDFTAVYRGFLESDGDRPSFPYPVTGLGGDFVASGDRLLFSMLGSIGEGTLSGTGAVQVGRGPAGVRLDLAAQDVAVDPRVGSAAAGTPGFAEIWRLLGNPEGGRADVEILARRPFGEVPVGLEVRGTGRGTRLEPTFLAVGCLAEDYSFVWRPGGADFGADTRTLGGSARLRGEVRSVSGLETPAIQVWADGEGLAPEREDRLVLEESLALPAGSADFAPTGDVRVQVAYRKPGGSSTPQVLVLWPRGGLKLAWEPTGLVLVDGEVAGGIVQSGVQLLISLNSRGDTTAASPVMGSVVGVRIGDEGPVRLVAGSPDLDVTGPALASLWRALRIAPPAGLQLGGRVRGVLQMEPETEGSLRARLDLADLSLKSSDFAHGEETLFRGPLQVDGGRIRSASIEMVPGEGSLVLSDVALDPLEDGWRFAATLDSEDGVAISEPLTALAGPDARSAVERVGLRGRLLPRGLEVAVNLPADSPPGFSVLGGALRLENVSLDGPPVMQDGAGVYEVESFAWNGVDDFRGVFQMRDGRALVSGLQVANSTARVVVNPGEIVLEDLAADALGGALSTTGTGTDGEAESGRIRLGLTPEAPLAVVLHLDELSLSRVQEELALGGNLSGKLTGRIEFTSATPSPLDYTGSGHLEVREGTLGTVPILSDLWEATGVRPPIFRRGHMDFQMNGAAGTVKVEEFVLSHDLLAVQGSGWIDMDGYLRLKVTIRTFSIFGRLPIIKDLIDLLVERNVFGPVERPVITSRAADKLSESPQPRHPFPLWRPDVPPPPWRASPALPVGGQKP